VNRGRRESSPMKIISASRRTDIPAFYAKWFMNRVQAGYCHWINPFNAKVYRVSLKPEDCYAFVFWTRNSSPLIPNLRDLHRTGYHFYFHVTINGYPDWIERNSPTTEKAIAAFKRLAEEAGPDLAFWRYDPILLSTETNPDYHLNMFDRISRQLEGSTQRCYFSFVDFYGKTERSLKAVEKDRGIEFERPDLDVRLSLVRRMTEMASGRGIRLYTCCGDDLLVGGVEKAHCIDWDLISKMRPEPAGKVGKGPTRQDCGCAEAADIGGYDTCVFGCRYCYATASHNAAINRLREHDPDDTILWRPPSLRGKDLDAVEVPQPVKPKRKGSGTKRPANNSAGSSSEQLRMQIDS
jgi:hypothetical protein